MADGPLRDCNFTLDHTRHTCLINVRRLLLHCLLLPGDVLEVVLVEDHFLNLFFRQEAWKETTRPERTGEADG